MNPITLTPKKAGLRSLTLNPKTGAQLPAQPNNTSNPANNVRVPISSLATKTNALNKLKLA